MSLTVIKSGFQDMIQDLGRIGYSHLGISEAGAADSISLRIGNILLGNNIKEAGIELTLFGGSYLFNRKAIILLSGSIFPSFIDNNPKTKKLLQQNQIIIQSIFSSLFT